LALIAWRRAGSSATGSGQGPAKFAVFLCLFLIGFAIAFRTLNDLHEQRNAVLFAQTWLEILRGENPQEAYWLTLAPNLRPAQVDEQVVGHVGGGARQLVNVSENEFYEQPVYTELADVHNRLELLAYSRQRSNDGRAQYRLLFQLIDTQLATVEHLAMIEIIGLPGADGNQYWQVGPCRLIDAAADPRGRSL
jgi:hypothetical protein